MHWLSEGIEALVAELDESADTRPFFDVVVVGSGYGGAVAACRLAQAGCTVCVLERGEEYVPGEFPNDLSNLPGEVRIERADRPGVIGNRNGLFDMRLHGHVTTLVGNALGGTSQINANVALRADPQLFRDARWPRALRDTFDPLDPYYTRAEDMLAVAPYPAACAKAQELERLVAPLNRQLRRTEWHDGAEPPQARFYRPPLAVTYADKTSAAGVAQRACTGCGDCVTGCNVGAKNTLTTNYLPLARRHGARFFTGATVLAVSPREQHRNVPCAEVYFSFTDRDLSAVQHLSPAQWEEARTRPGVSCVRAKRVVLAAGALGSTEILMRSRAWNLLECSPRLGSGFSGNGDALHFGFDQDRPVNAVGWGARPREGVPPGPSIVGVLDIRERAEPAQGMLVEDGIVPGAIARMAHELLTSVGTLSQLGAWTMKRAANGSDPLAVCEDALQRTQVYLAMGHDSASGALRLRHGRAFVHWPDVAREPVLARQDALLKKATKEVDALYLANPALEPLPRALRENLSGPPIDGTTLVVHPLGGCPMGEDFERGVVDDSGAVFSGETPRSTYASLYVWDGAILPGALGVNPMLTITALAERAAQALIARMGEDAQSSRPGALRPLHSPRAAAAQRTPVAVELRETMRGSLTRVGAQADTVLRLCMRIPDLDAFLSSAEHRVREVSGSLEMTGRAPFTVEAGSIHLLAPQPMRWWSRLTRTLRGLSEWLPARGAHEIAEYACAWLRGRRDGRRIWPYLVGVLKLAYHAGECREMRYRLELRSTEGRFTLEGEKRVRYRHSGGLWQSLLELPVTLRDTSHGTPPAIGALRLDLLALSEGDVPRVREAANLPQALLALGGVGLFFLRVLVKLHLWDFRAPSYAPRTLRAPLPEQRPLFVERVRSPFADAWLLPQRHWIQVSASRDTQKPTLPLALTRFGPPGNGHGVPVLLLHGYAQSSRAFACEGLRQDLIRHLHAQGFDVWLLDYRTSTALPSCREQSCLDDVAACDIPAAADYVLAQTGWRRLAAFGHCMGAATLAMSLLSGRLQGRLCSVVLSQVPPFIIGGYYSQFRRPLAAFLRNAIGMRSFNLAADDAVSGWEALLDRLLGTVPVNIWRAPFRLGWKEPDCRDPTCKRISGIIGPLYLHGNMRAAHPQLHHYFGWGSTSVLSHIAKFFEYERLMSADGGNSYATDTNIAAHLDLPIGLLHGDLNQVFHRDSAERTRKRINAIHGERCQILQIRNGRHYAHFDCLVGDHAHEDVYPAVSDFLLQHASACARIGTAAAASAREAA